MLFHFCHRFFFVGNLEELGYALCIMLHAVAQLQIVE